MKHLWCWGLPTLLVLCLGIARAEATGIPGWQQEWPAPERMLQGRDPAQVQQFLKWSAALANNPRDVNALDNRAYLAMEFAKRGLYRTLGGVEGGVNELALLWALNLSDGTHSLLDIAERSGCDFNTIKRAVDLLAEQHLLCASG